MKKKALLLTAISLVIIITGSIIFSSAFETDTASNTPITPTAQISPETKSNDLKNQEAIENTAAPLKLIYPDTSSVYGLSEYVQEADAASAIPYRKIDLQSTAATLQYSNTEKLTYAETEVYPNGKEIKHYLGEGQCIYSFNKDGKLVGWELPNDQWQEIVKSFIGKEAAVSDEEAVEIADKAVKLLFSDVADIVTYDSVHYYDNGGWYSIRYYEKLGKGSFINGLYCCVEIAGDGTVFSASMYNYDDVIDFDGSLLNDITKEQLAVLAKESMNNDYAELSDKITDFSLDGARLVCIDGKVVIEVSYVLKTPGWSGRTQTIADSCYLEIIE